MNECPKCKSSYNLGETDCKKCGIIFAKFEKIQQDRAKKLAETMIVCDACKKEISKNAVICQHCGEPSQEKVAEEPKKKFKNELTKSEQRNYLIATLIFLTIFVYFALNRDSSSSNKPENLTNMALIQCQNFVTQQLRSPASADFPFSDFESNISTDNLYIIRSYVDAQNGFGATIRTRWRCKARYTGGEEADQRNWTLVDLQMYKN
jgi:hypothetical protein